MNATLDDNSISSYDYICPHLGLSDDPKTTSAYPSELNVCFHVHPSSIPGFIHQRNFCLSSEHKDCPVYQTAEGQKMPKNIKYLGGSSSQRKKKPNWALFLTVTFIVMLVVLISLNNVLNLGIEKIFSQEIITPSIEITEQSISVSTGPTVTPEIVSNVSITNTPSETLSTPTQFVTLTPFQYDPILALDVPIGNEFQFIIHRVDEGESLQIFADKYNTSIEAIKAVNYSLIAPLWIDWLIVIPVDMTDLSGFPKFEPYQVEDQSTSLRDLSDSLLVPLDDLLLYNDLDPEHVLEQGEWLLIPRENPTP